MLTLLGSLLGFITSALPQRLALIAGIAIKLKLFGPSP
jgi:hypothetical protein